jgi:uncharacterized protein (DUF1330 family)
VAAYVMTDVEVLDQEPYEEYRRRFPATLEPFDGRLLFVGRPGEALEGNWQPRRLVVIEFPSSEQARDWYASPAYQAILPIRLQHAHSPFLTLVEGL